LKILLSVSTSRYFSKVVILSTGGIRPPPNSVDSLSFLQAENKEATEIMIAKINKVELLFFTKYFYGLVSNLSAANLKGRLSE
jgi:hypothetical protein